MIARGFFACLTAAAMMTASCAKPESSPSVTSAIIAPPPVNAGAPVHLPGLHNVVTYSDGLYSGGAPEGDDGFDSLVELGIHTIISVDGAQPDVEKAHAHGLRYVHLPIGYYGMDRTRTLEIARAVKELPGPAYIHCHHGKHRSAGATGATAVTLGLLTNEQATARMKVSGTSPNYVGLYGCVAVASLASTEELQSVRDDLPERYQTTGLVQTMVEIDHVFDALKAVQKARWQTPADHPDLVPVAEAGQLADLFRNLKDERECGEKPAEFMEWLQRAAAEASALETELDRGTLTFDVLDSYFAQITASCTDCHRAYRD